MTTDELSQPASAPLIPTTGTVVAIHVAPGGGEPMVGRDRVRAIAGVEGGCPIFPWPQLRHVPTWPELRWW